MFRWQNTKLERNPKWNDMGAGADVLQFGVYDDVAHFNIGSKTSVQILKELDMVPGLYFAEE